VLLSIRTQKVQEPTRVEPKIERMTLTISEAAKTLGVGRNQAYEAARRGDIPTLKIGKRILVLREPFKKMLAGGAA
jgi:excisionase family DNA binding protein